MQQLKYDAVVSILEFNNMLARFLSMFEESREF